MEWREQPIGVGRVGVVNDGHTTYYANTSRCSARALLNDYMETASYHGIVVFTVEIFDRGTQVDWMVDTVDTCGSGGKCPDCG